MYRHLELKINLNLNTFILFLLQLNNENIKRKFLTMIIIYFTSTRKVNQRHLVDN